MQGWSLVLSVLVLLVSGRASAAGACQHAVARWAAGCAARHGLRLEPVRCPPGRVVVRLEPAGAAAYDVEIGAPGRGSFRVSGGFGLSPIGEFSDWSTQPVARRRALDELAACLAADPGLPVAAPARASRRPGVPRAPPPALPWLVLAAAACSAAALWPRLRCSARTARVSGAVAALAFLVFAARWLVLPHGFFHQNGQGAIWIRQALDDRYGLSAYGPGFAELFGFVGWLAPHAPDRALFVADGVLGAAVVPLGWFVARRASGRRSIALVAAVVLAADPLLGRLAQSESYFAVGVLLAFAAAALLIAAGHRGRSGGRWWLAAVGAGLLVAQAARVQPLCWVPCALVPLVMLVLPGRLWIRVRQTVTSAAMIGVTVAVTSGRAMLEVLRGSLGQQWLPYAAGIHWQVPALAAGALVVAVVVVARFPRARPLLAAAVLASACAVAVSTNMVQHDVPWIRRACDRQFAPAALAAAAALAGRVAATARRARVAGLLLVATALVWFTLQWSVLTRVPTDAREANWLVEQRDRLPTGSTFVYVSRAGGRVFVAPLYPSHDPRFLPMPVRAEAKPPDPHALQKPIVYYRSSLCATPEGRDACRALESRFHLTAIARVELPAIASQPWRPLVGGPIAVGLYRASPR